MQGIFRHDEWINNEYLGLNTYFVGHSFLEVLGLLEQGLQMGYLTAALLLSKLKQSFDDYEAIGQVSYSGGPQQQLVTVMSMLDIGDQIQNSYRSFDGEARRAQNIRPSVDEEYGKRIAEFIDGVRVSKGMDVVLRAGTASRRSTKY